jgi:hypothetical protein
MMNDEFFRQFIMKALLTMKYISILGLLFFLMSAMSLKAQNIDIKKEEKEKENGGKINPIEIPRVGNSPSAPDKVADEISTDFIEISTEEAAIVTTRADRKERGRNRSSRQRNLSEMPPAKVFRVRLFIQNNNPHPMWYLMPYNGAVKLADNGLFNAEPSLLEGNKMLSVRVYEGANAGTKLKELLFTGMPNQHFRAFYLPAGGSLTLSNYNIDCWQDSETVEFWAVKSLSANGSESMEKILPYDLLSSMHTFINCPKNENCIYDILSVESQASTEEQLISFVKADKVSKYLIKLSGVQ